MTTLGFRRFNLAWVLFMDFGISLFLSFIATMLDFIAIAVIVPLTGSLKTPSFEVISFMYMFAFSLIIIFGYRVIFHLSEKIILDEESITFSNFFYRNKFSWKDIIGYSKPNFNMAQAGYGSQFRPWGPLNIMYYQWALKRGWIPFFIQLWIKSDKGKKFLFQKTISEYQWEPIFNKLEGKVPNPEEGKKQTQAKQFFIESKQGIIAILITLATLLGNVFIYFKFSS